MCGDVQSHEGAVDVVYSSASGFSGDEAGDDDRAFVLTGLRCRESANVMSKLVVDIAGNVVGEGPGMFCVSIACVLHQNSADVQNLCFLRGDSGNLTIQGGHCCLTSKTLLNDFLNDIQYRA